MITDRSPAQPTRARRWPRFGLQSLLLGVALLCLGFLVWVTRPSWWPYLVPVGISEIYINTTINRDGLPARTQALNPYGATRVRHEFVVSDGCELRIRAKEYSGPVSGKAAARFETVIGSQRFGLAENARSTVVISFDTAGTWIEGPSGRRLCENSATADTRSQVVVSNTPSGVIEAVYGVGLPTAISLGTYYDFGRSSAEWKSIEYELVVTRE